MFKTLFYLYILDFINFSACEKLIFAYLHSRHGARAPLDCDDKQFDFLGEKWTNPGELTATGQRMEYILGLRNRQRYINKYQLLSETFDPHELLVYSTNVNRTILSMQSQLQGLFPMYNQSGYQLTEEQIKLSRPPVDTSCEEIENEITNLQYSALPNYMTIVPIRTLSSSKRIINTHDSSGCKEKVNKTRDNNKVTKDSIKNAAEAFNANYSKLLNKYYDKNGENFIYDFDWIGLFCDTMVSDYSDGRKMEDFFQRTTINKDELLAVCRKMIYTNFRDDFYGDDKNEVILLAESNLIKEVLHYMKLRIDEDIKNKGEENSYFNVSDYSKPKMLIYSGHDSTLTAEELFMIKFFKINHEFFYPTYTTQLAFEITREEDKKDNLTYSSYNVNFYVNDELFMVENFEKFKNTVEENVWSAEYINEYCDGKKDSDSNLLFYAVIGVSCLAFIFIIIIICLIFKLKSGKNISPQDDNSNDNRLISEDDN